MVNLVNYKRKALSVARFIYAPDNCQQGLKISLTPYGKKLVNSGGITQRRVERELGEFVYDNASLVLMSHGWFVLWDKDRLVCADVCK